MNAIAKLSAQLTPTLAAVGSCIALLACEVGQVPARQASGGGDDNSGGDDEDTPGSPDSGTAPIEPGTPDGSVDPGPPFSFFVTSLQGMRDLSGSEDGFGGDLGGLAGADSICQQLGTAAGAGNKTWRAFLSVTDGGDGNPVHARDRIGTGPWYDKNGRLVAENLTGLLQQRPDGDAQIKDDLPDELGVPLTTYGDSHDVLTGSNSDGMLEVDNPVSTCADWTSDVGPGSENQVRCGHAWPAGSGQHWIMAHRVRGCSPGVNLVQNGSGTGDCVGCGGGWGAIYCFALTP